jgi:hypothetical protein
VEEFPQLDKITRASEGSNITLTIKHEDAITLVNKTASAFHLTNVSSFTTKEQDIYCTMEKRISLILSMRLYNLAWYNFGNNQTAISSKPVFAVFDNLGGNQTSLYHIAIKTFKKSAAVMHKSIYANRNMLVINGNTHLVIALKIQRCTVLVVSVTTWLMKQEGNAFRIKDTRLYQPIALNRLRDV